MVSIQNVNLLRLLYFICRYKKGAWQQVPFFVLLSVLSSCQHKSVKPQSLDQATQDQMMRVYISEQEARIKSGVYSSKPQYLACYQKSKEENEGYAVYYFMLTKQGRVTQMKLTQTSFGNGELLNCLNSEFQKTQFPEDAKESFVQADSIPIMVPLEFRKVNDKIDFFTN